MKLFRVALVLSALVASACAGSLAPPKVKSGVERQVAHSVFQEGMWKRSDHVALYTRSWAPAEGAPLRGVLVVVHGLRDHGDRYAPLARRLVAAGFAVHAADLRGHGQSWGKRVWVDDFDDYVDDLDAYVAKVRHERPGVPVFLLGHSMGGTIVVRYVQERKPDLAGVVLSAPALGLHNLPLLGSLLAFNGVALPSAPLLLLDNDDFSRDRLVVHHMNKDVLISEAGPARTGAELVGAIGAAWRDAAAVSVPLLVLHGTGDKITAPDASRDFLERVSSEDRTLQLYQDFWHDLLHEPGGERVAADIEAWLGSKLGGAAPALSASAPPASAERPYATTGSLHVGGSVMQGLGDDSVDIGGYGHLRLTLARPAGWYGGVSVTRYHSAGNVTVYPLGLGIRLGDGGLLAVAGGVAPRLDWIGLPVEAALELPVGPVHLVAAGEVRWVVDYDGADTERVIDAHLGVRLPGSRPYWQRVVLGSGVYLGGTYQRVLDENIFGVELGLHFWGAR